MGSGTPPLLILTLHARAFKAINLSSQSTPNLAITETPWLPFGKIFRVVLLYASLSGGTGFCEHVGSVKALHPRLPSTTPSVSGAPRTSKLQRHDADVPTARRRPARPAARAAPRIRT